METESPIVPAPSPADPDAFTLAFLAENEAECPACGYNVHALREARCPECGRSLRVMVVTVEGGFSAAWIILMLAASLAAGVGLLVAAVSVRSRLPPQWHFKLVLIYFMLNIPLPLLALAFRRQILRLRAFQWLLTAPFVLLSLLMLLWFLAEIKY
jgi:hypothetical protein